MVGAGNMKQSAALHYIRQAIERPLMIMPEKLAIISAVLEGRIGVDASDLKNLVDEGMLAYVNKPAADRFAGEREPNDPNNLRAGVKPYKVSNGVAIISLVGSLVNRGAWIGSVSDMTSYEGFRHQLASAGRDNSIHSVLLDIDSPGGEAIGAFEAGEDVRKLNDVKPVSAFVNGLCCSAAYAIASQASRIETGSTSILGSIGVVMMHVDQSKRLHDLGVKPTFIHAGKKKVDGNPFEPLSNEVKAALQADVDKFYDLFVAHVASGRKGLSAKAIREQEAGTFMGNDAVNEKLADGIGKFEATLLSLQRRSKTRTMKMESENMLTQAQHETLLAAAINNATTATTQSVTAALTAEHTTAMAAAVSAARAEGATAERERIRAVLALPEANGRQASALHMALTTDMAADAIKPVLTGLPLGSSAAASVPSNGFGLVVDKPLDTTAAANSWDAALVRSGATLPEKKTA